MLKIRNKNRNKNNGIQNLCATNHVYQRLKERFNIDYNNADDFIQKALEQGIVLRQFRGNEYLIYDRCEFVLYNGKIITVYDRFEGTNI
jgi:hypothetical protein